MHGGFSWTDPTTWGEAVGMKAKEVLPSTMTNPTLHAKALDIPTESAPSPPALDPPVSVESVAAGGRRKSKRHGRKHKRTTRKH